MTTLENLKSANGNQELVLNIIRNSSTETLTEIAEDLYLDFESHDDIDEIVADYFSK